MKLKVMTYNVQHCMNYYSRKIDFDIMADTIKKCDADMVGLQEVRAESPDPEYENQLKILSEKTGLLYRRFGKAIDFERGPYGNGFLSSMPVLRTAVIPIPDPKVKTGREYYESRSILKVLLKSGITVLVTHFGLNLDERENAVKTVLRNIKDEKCILMGDFNSAPEEKVLDGIKRRMTDTADMFKAPLLSFPSDKPETKIDYIFVSRDIKVVSADVLKTVSSDHRPVTAVLEV